MHVFQPYEQCMRIRSLYFVHSTHTATHTWYITKKNVSIQIHAHRNVRMYAPTHTYIDTWRARLLSPTDCTVMTPVWILISTQGHTNMFISTRKKHIPWWWVWPPYPHARPWQLDFRTNSLDRSCAVRKDCGDVSVCCELRNDACVCLSMS